MKLKILVLIAAMAICGIASANANYPQHMSIQLFQTDCELPDRPSQIRCETFLRGVVDTVNALSDLGELEKSYFCIPEGFTEVRLRKIFVDYMATQSDVDLSASAASHVILAFGAAFPCE
jgi:Rap1a immunity proteins